MSVCGHFDDYTGSGIPVVFPGFYAMLRGWVSVIQCVYKKTARSRRTVERFKWGYEVYTAMRLLSLLSSREEPIRYSSTLRAHSLPSLMAQTTSDCPRRMSPQLKMRVRFVW